MAPPRWTTAAELSWLQNEVPTYLQMQKEKKIVRFFELLYPKWFSGFPEHLRVWPREPSKNSPDEDTEIDESGLDLANDEVNAEPDHENSLDAEQTEVLNAAIKHRRKKLREWFRNNTKGKTTPGGTSTSKILTTLLGQRARGTRDLKEVEFLTTSRKTTLYYLIRSFVLSGSTRANVLQTESEDVKDEVRDETVRINAARKLGSVVAGQDRTKEEIYRAIQELPIVLGQIFEELSTLTGGWHYSLVMGGPDPLCEGDIMTLSFKTSTPNFHEQYLLPFEKYLGRIYGPSVKGTSVPASASSSPPPSTINLVSPSAPCAPPPLTTDFISTSAPSAPPLSTMDLSTSTPSVPPLSTTDLPTSTSSVPPLLTMDPSASTPNEPSDQSSARLLQGQEFNTSGLVLDPPQWNGWQSHPDPNPSYMSSIAPDSPITAWRREYGFNENGTMSAALPSAIMQPQLPYSPPLTFVPDIPVHQHSLPASLPESLLPKPAQLVSSPQPALPLEPDQVMLAHNSKPSTSSEHTVATQARRSGCSGRPSTRAEEANKIGDTSLQQVTKAGPKRKQNAPQYTTRPHYTRVMYHALLVTEGVDVSLPFYNDSLDAIGANHREDKVIRLEFAIVVNMLEKSKPQQHPEETITARHV
ncbi:hypothetical protein DFJ58DRAFT_845534 [Suillus subalutaceus]|uniref:uncharacterized protein n=1 Tax=Suillus subalutaceus TaxID=48586 RepID=UPI001B865F90|nr:uncharacterized protein DFJ58DRAFT_845534 [Suillus subalutaceus]KAG1840003.1 hypothetical protein DFJ58DRAFT_845534 [Suillus subalutaceus]